MHELGVASEILGIVLSESARHKAKKVTLVKLRVGVLRGIVPENLLFLFGHIAKETPAENAALEIEEETVRVECASCGTNESPSFVMECPVCRRSGIRVSGGDSLLVVSIEMDA
ncbi:MAG: hydrogenase maturation nickel metallochaperone HypA [Deltaproteobacteria bacterium]|nr:hydrogenase maturation nickel metallochaperone HypA [Deltaproteobacteria bacterium]